MKKYIMLLCGVICACMAFAQSAASVWPKNKTAVINHKAPLTYVTEQPEGELKSYKRSGWAYVEEVDGIYNLPRQLCRKY